jgi:hypothetical protein
MAEGNDGYCILCSDFKEISDILVKQKQQSVKLSFCSRQTIGTLNGIDFQEPFNHPLKYTAQLAQTMM